MKFEALNIFLFHNSNKHDTVQECHILNYYFNDTQVNLKLPQYCQLEIKMYDKSKYLHEHSVQEKYWKVLLNKTELNSWSKMFQWAVNEWVCRLCWSLKCIYVNKQMVLSVNTGQKYLIISNGDDSNCQKEADVGWNSENVPVAFLKDNHANFQPWSQSIGIWGMLINRPVSPLNVLCSLIHTSLSMQDYALILRLTLYVNVSDAAKVEISLRLCCASRGSMRCSSGKLYLCEWIGWQRKAGACRSDGIHSGITKQILHSKK